jgi:hypothetical protein
MAQYKYLKFLKENTSKAFDDFHVPSATTPYSGIWGYLLDATERKM